MASQPKPGEDPLIVTLPPATDYITYLTLLEYQLTPQNLPTLNRLLGEDDGTLASEIGWDLLKLVLPMLSIVPDAARNCLEIVARRGNPREVVVRVAEELERLSSDDGYQQSEDDEDYPTFAGEAPRVHLGDMTLDGMPPASRIEPNQSIEQAVVGDVLEVQLEIQTLQVLLSMLSLLHPRIKTQYPSRFLATSLPAALGAYRRTNITSTTTSSFLTALSNLSGKRRPNLPPRKSTGVFNDTKAPSTAVVLPDPESNTGTDASKSLPSEGEAAIVQKLLQAVMLEVLEEYTTSLQTEEVAHMSWTQRLRDKFEPKRNVPHRINEINRWNEVGEFVARNDVLAQFLRLASDINLDIANQVQRLLNPPVAEEDRDSEEEHEYPNTPEQIPFTTSGLVILYAAKMFSSTIESSNLLTMSNIVALLPTIRPIIQGVAQPNLCLIDAYTSLLYQASMKSNSEPDLNKLDNAQTIPLFDYLIDIFITTPDANIRDNAHHTATIILRKHTQQSIRLTIIKNMLTRYSNSSSSAIAENISPLYEIQSGNLKAIAVDWLKEQIISTAPDTISLSILDSDTEVLALIFPDPANTPHPDADGTSLEANLIQIPYYIASLNLLSILATRTKHSTSSTDVVPPRVFQHATQTLSTLETWRDELVALAALSSAALDGPISSDVYALDLACSLAREAVNSLGVEREGMSV